MDAPPDEQLLRDFLAGDGGGFELLARRHHAELYQFAMRITASSAAAEDVVQETMLRVYLSASSFDPERKFKSWLFAIAANKARDYLRNRERKHEVPLDGYAEDEQESGRRFVDLLSAEPIPQEDDLGTEDRRRLVRSAIGLMPVKLREVLILAYYHRFSYREIGDIVNIPVGTVKSRLHAAIVDFGGRYRAAVRQRMKNEHG
ncbi:MAG: sigma-70 family RNA polymerase sigma factor [Planctomycetota bacterium]